MSSLEEIFPNLAGSRYLVTSPATPKYNCIAWAAGDDGRWWWPDVIGHSYWPDDVPREETLSAFRKAFATLGYSPATDPQSEPNVSKIAIFARDGIPTHAARQLPSGQWTSKLGEVEDISHELNDVAGSLYGEVAIVLARKEA